MRGHPSGRDPGDRINVRRGLVQASSRQHFRRHHSEQEPVGLRVQQVHHPLDHFRRLRAAHHVEYEPDLPLVCLWDRALFLGQEDEGLDEEFQCPLFVALDLDGEGRVEGAKEYKRD